MCIPYDIIVYTKVRDNVDFSVEKEITFENMAIINRYLYIKEYMQVGANGEITERFPRHLSFKATKFWSKEKATTIVHRLNKELEDKGSDLSMEYYHNFTRL